MRNYLYFSLIFTLCTFCLLSEPIQRVSDTNKSEESIIFNETLLKAQDGDPAAQLNIGQYFLNGDPKAGVVKNVKDGEEWLLKSARQGYPPALSALSVFCNPFYNRSTNIGTDPGKLAEYHKWRYLYDLKHGGVAKWDKPIKALSEETKLEAIKRGKQFLDENITTFNNFYWVERGDTIGSIAKKMGLSPEIIKKINPTINPNNLIVGDKIRLK
jgi:hypothetical protein